MASFWVRSLTFYVSATSLDSYKVAKYQALTYINQPTSLASITIL